MSDFVILTDSSCDMPDSLAKELGLSVVPLKLDLDGKTYRNYLDNSDIHPKVFYNALRSGSSAKTSAVNVDEFTEAMEEILKEGKDLLYIGFSSALSATYSVGEIAAKELREKYPERKIETVDSLAASLGQGLYVYLIAKFKASGKTIEETKKYAEEIKLNIVHLFTVSDLNFLYRGGRVSRATSIIGTAINIKPLMHVDTEGRLTKTGVIRGRKQSINALKDKMAKTVIDKSVAFISHGDCLEEAEMLADMVKKEIGVKEVLINHVGPVIGAHSGPGTMALFYLGTERTETK